MQERGVEVLELHDLLAETLEDPEARDFVLDRRITANHGRRSACRGSSAPGWTRCRPRKLAEHLIGGIAIVRPARRATRTAMLERGLRRRPTSSCRRCRTPCSSATRPAGSTAASPAIRCSGRRASRKPCCSAQSTSSTRPSRTATSRSGGATPTRTSPARRSKAATSCRSARASCSSAWASAPRGRPCGQVARELFRNKAATRVIGCLMPKSRAAMHLDTVFSFCDRDLVTIFRGRGRPDPLLQHLPDRRRRRLSRSAPRPGPLLEVVRDALGLERAAVGRRPAATPTRPSASSGTTATTSWRSSPASSSPTTATPTPTRCCARPASR